MRLGIVARLLLLLAGAGWGSHDVGSALDDPHPRRVVVRVRVAAWSDGVVES